MADPIRACVWCGQSKYPLILTRRGPACENITACNTRKVKGKAH